MAERYPRGAAGATGARKWIGLAFGESEGVVMPGVGEYDALAAAGG
ncbi:MAG: hypothetical protein NTU53_00620 [Planctomycetota bacterium]|nr:hypothetical protein [Planctomycetota bacterium]